MDATGVKFLCPSNDEFYSASKYQPLNNERLEIRLLEVLPGRGRASIQCRLQQPVSLLPPAPEFLALSYCAGDLNDTGHILLDDTSFNVFKPIEEASRRIRRGDRALHIWIDQCCINQSNAKERGEQVSIMSEIYSQASETIAWLGEGDPLVTSNATAFVKKIVRMWNAFKLYEVEQDLSCGSSSLSHGETTSQYELLLQRCALQLRSADIDAFLFIARRSWWRRCWVAQEAILSRKVQLWCGDLSLSLDDVDLANRCLYFLMNLATRHDATSRNSQLVSNSLDIFRIKSLLSLLDLRRKWRQSGRRLNLDTVLETSRSMKASDPRDKIYAMLGLLGPCPPLQPCYNAGNTVGAVFVEATEHIVSSTGNLDILVRRSGDDGDLSFNLPTWTPDFSKSSRSLILFSGKRELQRYPACAKRKLNVTSPAFRHNDGDASSVVLSCYIYSLGAVAQKETLGVVGTLGDAESRISQADIYRDWGNTMSKSGIGPVYKHTGESAEVAFQSCLHGRRPTPRGANVKESHVSSDEFPKSCQEMTALYMLSLMSFNCWRFFANPSSELIGIIPAAARHDDILVLAFDASGFFVLRKLEGKEGHCYTFVGPAYIHGFDASYLLEELYSAAEDDPRLADIHEVQIY